MPRTGYTRAAQPPADPGSSKLVYTITEAAAAVGVHVVTLREAARAGELEHRWLNSHKMLVSRTALLAWFERLPADRPEDKP